MAESTAARMVEQLAVWKAAKRVANSAARMDAMTAGTKAVYLAGQMAEWLAVSKAVQMVEHLVAWKVVN